MPIVSRFLIVLLLASSCIAQEAAEPSTPAVYSNPVIAGDYPDPSVIRVGQDYWATATAGEWEPEFQLLHSHDLVNWEVVSAVFPTKPTWAEGNFWAPEISEYKGRYFVFYTGRKKGGPLCVAVASASAPVGPYTDHGPLVCQDDGSIDAFSIADENGQRYLIWKEDGNSRNQPTPIWAQPLSDDGTVPSGEKKQLIANDEGTWEGKVVEGAFVLRRNNYFYLFYSGAACCGLQCNYGLGVARSEKLLGPYEKYEKNPLVASNEAWRCPGHGSIVTDENGRDFFLFHSYSAKDFIFVGRESVLEAIQWDGKGWPLINGGKGVSTSAPSPFGVAQKKTLAISDDFSEEKLNAAYQWPKGEKPAAEVRVLNGKGLALGPGIQRAGDRLGGMVARATRAGDYLVSTSIVAKSIGKKSSAGLAAVGDNENAVGISVTRGKVSVWRRQNNNDTVVSTAPTPRTAVVHLRMKAAQGHVFQFAISTNGSDWVDVGGAVDGNGFLTPWDRSVRVALITGGPLHTSVQFNNFEMMPLNAE